MFSNGDDRDQHILKLYQTGKAREGLEALAQVYWARLVATAQWRLGDRGHLRGHDGEDIAQLVLLRTDARLQVLAERDEPVQSLAATLHLKLRSVFHDYSKGKKAQAAKNLVPLNPGLGGIPTAFLEESPAPGDWTQVAVHGQMTPGTEPQFEVDVPSFGDPIALIELKRRREAFLDCLNQIPNERYRRALKLWLLELPARVIGTQLHFGGENGGVNGAMAAIRRARLLVFACLRQKGEDIPESLVKDEK